MKRSPTLLEMILSIILILAQIFYATTVGPNPEPPNPSCPVVSTRPIVDPKVLDDEADVRFYRRHPELHGRKLNQYDDEALLKEWRVIRQQVQANVFEHNG